MANGTNAPFGLRPYSSISGGSWTEKTNTYFIFANDAGTVTYDQSIFTGDPVILNPVAAENILEGSTIIKYPINTATVVTDNTPVLGVFMGCEYESTVVGSNNLIKSPFWPASSQVKPGSKITAYVLDDPDVIFDIQVSTATNVLVDAAFSPAAATAAYFSQNFAFGIAAGGANLVPNNPTTGDRFGQSAVYLNMVGTTATNRTAATLPLKVIGFTPDPENVVLDPNNPGVVNPFLNVRVMINNHVFRVGNLGATVA